jgi:hypothetical protein
VLYARPPFLATRAGAIITIIFIITITIIFIIIIIIIIINLVIIVFSIPFCAS